MALVRLLLVLLLAFAGGAARAEALRGVALVIGQSEYRALPGLANPAVDARRIEAMLDGLGFETTIGADLTGRKLNRALAAFADDAEGADVALIYYAGHGIEAGGENFLVPVDADGAGGGLVAVTPVFDAVKSRAKVTIILLDACRSNPYPPGTLIASGDRRLPAGAAGLGAQRGFGLISDGGESLGGVVGFAAEPGRVALDGAPGANSPYAAALLKHLPAPGFDFGDVMTLVAEEVYLATNAQQLPWTNASLRRLLYFGGAEAPADADDALIRGERRKLLLTIAATPAGLRRDVERIAGEAAVPLAGLYDVLRALDKTDLPEDPAELDALLSQQAEVIRALMADRRALDAGDPRIMKLADLAGRAIDEGAMPAARNFIDRAKALVEAGRGAIERTEAQAIAKRRANAEVYGLSGDAYLRAFDHLSAAADYRRAFDWVKTADAMAAFDFKMSEASALGDHGGFLGEARSFRRSIAAYEEALALLPRNREPAKWASALNDLGATLFDIGKREAGTATLGRALDAFEQALEVRTRGADPAGWAKTQANLALVLAELGEREAGTSTLVRAVNAFEAVIEAGGPGSPGRANALNSLGTVYRTLARRGGGKAMAERSIAAFSEALAETARDGDPLRWSEVQSNLGAAHRALADFADAEDNLAKAIASYRAALEAQPRARYPLNWASTTGNLALAQRALGERRKDAAMLKGAVALMAEALTEITPERGAMDWSGAQQNHAVILLTYGELARDKDALESAIAAYDRALTIRTRDGHPLDWADLQNGRAGALLALGRLTGSKALVREGRQGIEAAWRAVKDNGFNADRYFRDRLARFDKILNAME